MKNNRYTCKKRKDNVSFDKFDEHKLDVGIGYFSCKTKLYDSYNKK